mgnify:CR=1 FL=1
MKLVTFDIDSKTDISSIEKIIKSQEEWAHLSQTTWLVGGNLKYDELRDLLSPFGIKHLVVIPFDYYHWASKGCSEDITEFLNKHLSVNN